MIKFQFKIIVEKGAVKKTFKPFLSRTVSTIALILSVIVLSAIIGLGINLVLAQLSPSGGITFDEDPDSPGKRMVSFTGLSLSHPEKKWKIYSDGSLEGNVGRFGEAHFKGNSTTEKLLVTEYFVVLNQGQGEYKSAFRSQDSSAATIMCPEGSYLYAVRINKDGRYSYGYCSAPLEPRGKTDEINTILKEREEEINKIPR